VQLNLGSYCGCVMNKGLSGIDVNFFKILLILYADNKAVFAESKDELQRSLDALLEYCNR